MDFAKLVEVFDAHGVTFVSITQSFNTTTSMGRLTLNVLLSFAQFEREVAGERIRDKIAASKRKGMWMGGTVPLGYDVKERRLVVNAEEAERVQHIFQRYMELGNLNDLYQDLNRRGIKGKLRKLKNKDSDHAPFCCSTVHYLLCNPTYIGKVRHKGQIYEGQHEPIVPPELWQAVQDRLTNQSITTRNHKKHKQKNLLQGLMFDQADRLYVPTYTNKLGKQYRYYRLHEKTVAEDVLDRLPAHEIESRVEEAIRQELTGFDKAGALLGIDPRTNPDLIQIVNQKQISLPSRDLVLAAVQKVIIDHQNISLQINIQNLSSFINEQLGISLSPIQNELYTIKIPYITRRAHKGSIVIDADKTANTGDPLDLPSGELRNLIRGLIWRHEHFKGMTLRDIAKREGFSEGYVGKCIFKTFELQTSQLRY